MKKINWRADYISLLLPVSQTLEMTITKPFVEESKFSQIVDSESLNFCRCCIKAEKVLSDKYSGARLKVLLRWAVRREEEESSKLDGWLGWANKFTQIYDYFPQKFIALQILERYELFRNIQPQSRQTELAKSKLISQDTHLKWAHWFYQPWTGWCSAFYTKTSAQEGSMAQTVFSLCTFGTAARVGKQQKL